MSGGLRSAAAPVKARLMRYLAEVPPTLVLQQSDQISPEQQLVLYEEHLQLLDRAQFRIQSTVETLSSYEQQWVEIIARNPDLAPAEEALWEQHATGDGFLAVLNLGREQLTELMLRIQAIKRAIDHLSMNSSQPLQQKGVGSPPFLEGSHVRLPKLELQTFHGDPKAWPVFWDWFDATINQQQIPDIQKLSYLKECMRGRAQVLVSAYSLHSQSYETVLKRLKEQYGDKEIIVQELYDALESLPSVHEGTQLRSLVEDLERILELLCHQGEDVNNRMIQRAIENKLPKWILLEFERQKTTVQNWNVASIRKSLATLALSYDTVFRTLRKRSDHADMHREKQYSRSRQEGPKKVNSLNTFTTMPLQSSNTQKPRKPQRCCELCSQSHWASQCTSYPSVDSRMERCRVLRLCYRCLVKGHRASLCDSRNKCFYCSHPNHHSCLCRRRDHKIAQVTAANNAPQMNKRHETLDRSSPVEQTAAASTITVMQPANRTSILLCCVEAEVCNPKNTDIRTEALTFIDPGSQRSFITQALVDKLRIQCGPAKELHLVGLAEREPHRYTTKLLLFI
ncbi:unnamed protein product [Gongylonema pulchrum]|uniref:DUF1758 domain-containing protein n=1 Tax=Gongylonema pulchrum TaxID=637853 RepID=A0A183ENB3_9BILA|nr:unnamed protein product [Gongylonema pulchrum]